MLTTLFAMSFSLFLLMDSFGNIPIYLILLEQIEPRRRRWIILREMMIALAIIILFACFGDNLLRLLHISHKSIFFAGGIVLFIMAIKMLFPENGSLHDAFNCEGEPLIFPLAIPLISGPSILAAVMIYSYQLNATWMLFVSIIIAWIASTAVLLSSTWIQKWLGPRGIKALERLMGLILILIAIEMFLEGVNLCQLAQPIPKLN